LNKHKRGALSFFHVTHKQETAYAIDKFTSVLLLEQTLEPFLSQRLVLLFFV